MIDPEKLPPVIKHWADVVASGDVDQIVNSYAVSAKLKGTIWQAYVPRRCAVEDPDPEASFLRDYFNAFTAGKNSPHVEFQTCESKELKGGMTQHRGNYVFKWTDAAGAAKELEARFIFIETQDGKILRHRSNPGFETTPVC